MVDDRKYMKYIDLSHEIYNGIPVYPGDIEVSLVQVKTISEDEYNYYSFSSGLHAGTHIDCPMHLLQKDSKIAEYPLECFIGKGYLIDARGEDKIDYKEKYSCQIQKDDIVLILTETDKKYGSEDYYNKHPVLSNRLADFLVSRQIKMLGIDMPSPDLPPFPVHKLLLSNDIFIIENLTNLGQLLNIEYFEVFAQPLKICAEASFTRAFARCP
jgi:kynurenine formamidase